MLKLQELLNTMSQDQKDMLEARRQAKLHDPMRRAFNILRAPEVIEAERAQQEAASLKVG